VIYKFTRSQVSRHGILANHRANMVPPISHERIDMVPERKVVFRPNPNIEIRNKF